MTGKRIVFIVVLLMVAFGSYMFMNKDYDPLARYQYKLSTEQHNKVTANLSSKEIEYLIEYAIAPQEFIDYVGLEGFNIYLLDYYNEMYDLYGWIESKETIMKLVNVTRDIYTKDELKAVIDDYYIYEILTYYQDGNTEKLALNVNDVTFMIPDERSIGYYGPKDLVDVDERLTVNGNVSVRLELKMMIDDMFLELKTVFPRTYDVIKIDRGYLSYQQLSSLFQTTNDPIYTVGHSDYQLGLVIDLVIGDDSFESSDLGQWIINNAYRYGFILYGDLDEKTMSFRYVGIALASSLFEQQVIDDEVADE